MFTIKPDAARASALALLPLLAGTLTAQTWQAGPAFPDTTAPRSFASGLALNGAVYAFGGLPLALPDQELSPVHQLLPQASSWNTLTDLEGATVRTGVGVDSIGHVIVFGGVDPFDPGGDLGKSYWYDLVEGKKGNTGQRTAAAPDDHFAFATDDAQRIYSIGGGPRDGATAGNPNSAHVERYSATSDTWTAVAPMLTAVADASAVNDGAGHLLVIGGYDAAGARTANVARFDVASGLWSDTAVPDLPVPTAELAAVRGADGRVYALGGATASGTTDAVWVLDAAGLAWSQGPSLGTPRQNLAAALGGDDFIYALGSLAGTGTMERLYTPVCPSFPVTPAAPTAWVGQSAVFEQTVAGGVPMSYRWRKDGLDLFDGATAGGGWITGSGTERMVLSGVSPSDAGDYELAATNPCGTTLSPALPLTVLEPPSLAGIWTVENLHPAGALSSRANGLADGEVVGTASYPDPTYTSLAHPLVWMLGDGSVQDLTPANSVGGSLSCSAGGTRAGWYWWPYSTPQGTGYDSHAAVWEGGPSAHIDVQPSGWEYGSVADTDGTRHVGSMRFDDMSTTGHAAYWKSSQKFAIKLTPAGDWGSNATAMYGAFQYGSVVHPFANVHAAMWQGTAASFVDLNPTGSSWSYVSGADLGAQVGRATFAGISHAVLWNGDAESYVDLHPTGATTSVGMATHGGLQVGTAGLPASRTVLWSGEADSYLDLSALVGPEFANSFPTDVRLLANGDVLVSGYGYNQVTGRTEALLWHMHAQLLSGDPGTIPLAAGGTQQFELQAGAAHAGELYLIAGSASGTSPGLPVDGLVLPLNWDAYLQFSITVGPPIYTDTVGLLDAAGGATAAFLIPAGASPNLAGVALNHAGLVLDLAAGGVVTLVTNPVPVTFVP